jgi:hypothetical protein
MSKFSNVHHLTMFFTDTFDSDAVMMYYVNFKGVDTKVWRCELLVASLSQPTAQWACEQKCTRSFQLTLHGRTSAIIVVGR